MLRPGKVWSGGSYNQVIILIILAMLCAAILPGFLNRLNLVSIGYQYGVIGLIALGQFAVILTKGIDLSQGSVIAASSMATALAAPWGLPAAVAAGCLVGLGFGLLNGVLVSFTRISPFIVTLGVMGIARGTALTVTNGSPVPVRLAGLSELARGRLLEIPYPFLIFLLAATIIGLFLTQWPQGRYFYAVGGHEHNATLSAVPVKRTKLLAYSVSGLLAGIAGVIITARIGTGHPLTGLNYELESIAAVIVGGASLFGGTGNVVSVGAGVLILGTINSAITLSGISPYLHGTLKGAIVLVAVALSQLQTSFKEATR